MDKELPNKNNKNMNIVHIIYFILLVYCGLNYYNYMFIQSILNTFWSLTLELWTI